MAEETQGDVGVRIGEVEGSPGIPTVFYNGERRLGLATASGFGPEYITVITQMPGEDVRVQIMGAEDFLFVVHHATDILAQLEGDEDNE